VQTIKTTADKGSSQEHGKNIKKEETNRTINKRKQLDKLRCQTDHLNPIKEDQVVSPSVFSSHYMNKALPNRPSKTSLLGDPPYDIERPNCVPGFGSHNINDDFEHDQISIDSARLNSSTSPPSSINSFDPQPLNEEDEYEDMYDTHKSHTPSTSGDSGYGTTRNKASQALNKQKSNDTMYKAQDLFEALFAPATDRQQTGRLSLLFTKTREKKEPHFVKFQTWSSNKNIKSPMPTSSVSSTIRRPHEEKLFSSKALPAVIKVETPLVRKTSQQRPRRSTDASLLRHHSIVPPSPTKPTKSQHSRSRSIGSALDHTEKIFSPVNSNSVVDSSDKLDLYDDNKELIARYVSNPSTFFFFFTDTY
jgi:hypothetical protein